jgi:hypothetical protein
MKKTGLYIVIMCLFITSCSVVGGIFKAGMVWGIILVVLVIAAIIALITRGGKK